jgi:TM2 domain-containing membrane protein YozV
MMKDRNTAIIICFFLGGFGLHKFYLGQISYGVMYALFSWTFIPSIIAFFDFLDLCFMPDRKFNLLYNQEYLNGIDGNYGIALNPSPEDATNALYSLKKLYEDGVITAEEYEEKRRKMLDKI